MKFGHIAPSAKGYDYFGGQALVRIVFRQPSANIVGPDPNNRIGFGVIVDGAAEKFGAEETFSQAVEFSIQCVGHDVLEEVLASFAPLKQRACKDSL